MKLDEIKLKVCCIEPSVTRHRRRDNDGFVELKVGEIYELRDGDRHSWNIKYSDGTHRWWQKEYFRVATPEDIKAQMH